MPMIRRGLVLILGLAVMVTLSGCTQKKIEGYVAEMGEKVIVAAEDFMEDYEAKKAQKEQESEGKGADLPEEESVPVPVEESIVQTEDCVILTLDYSGLEKVHSFRYEGGVLVEGTVYILCETDGEKDTARNYFVQANVEAACYEGIRTGDTMVSAIYMASALEAYAGLSMDQLQEQLALEYGL